MKMQIKSLVAVAVVAAAGVSTAVVAQPDTPNYKAPVANPSVAPKTGVGSAAANRYTQALITRMDVDKNGTVTKAEFLKFMEAEFNALDKNKSGFLETTEMLRKEILNRTDKD